MVLYQSSNLPNDDLPKQKPHELDPWESQQKKKHVPFKVAKHGWLKDTDQHLLKGWMIDNMFLFMMKNVPYPPVIFHIPIENHHF